MLPGLSRPVSRKRHSELRLSVRSPALQTEPAQHLPANPGRAILVILGPFSRLQGRSSNPEPQTRPTSSDGTWP
ncbi:hypothetical protein CSE45_5502 [Citreicella sp. SE45]|nr:hypothetical protein CSE45_5502 [Citreicella sp. SE45]